MILRRTNRRGVVLVMALALMTTVAIILSVVTLQVVGQRQFLNLRERLLQADWLVRSGVDLAAARLLEDPSAFVLERTDLVPDTTVKIVVEKSDKNTYMVTVGAEIGAADEKKVARTVSRQFRRVEEEGVVRLTAADAE